MSNLSASTQVTFSANEEVALNVGNFADINNPLASEALAAASVSSGPALIWAGGSVDAPQWAWYVDSSGNIANVQSPVALPALAANEEVALTVVNFADVNAPLASEALAAASITTGPAVIWSGGTVDDPMYTWFVDSVGNIVQIESPSSADFTVVATVGGAPDSTDPSTWPAAATAVNPGGHVNIVDADGCLIGYVDEAGVAHPVASSGRVRVELGQDGDLSPDPFPTACSMVDAECDSVITSAWAEVGESSTTDITFQLHSVAPGVAGGTPVLLGGVQTLAANTKRVEITDIINANIAAGVSLSSQVLTASGGKNLNIVIWAKCQSCSTAAVPAVDNNDFSTSIAVDPLAASSTWVGNAGTVTHFYSNVDGQPLGYVDESGVDHPYPAIPTDTDTYSTTASVAPASAPATWPANADGRINFIYSNVDGSPLGYVDEAGTAHVYPAGTDTFSTSAAVAPAAAPATWPANPDGNINHIYSNVDGTPLGYVDEGGTAHPYVASAGNTSVFTDNTAGNGLDNGTIVHDDGNGTIVTANVCNAIESCISTFSQVSSAQADPYDISAVETHVTASSIEGPTVLWQGGSIDNPLHAWFVAADESVVKIKNPDTCYTVPAAPTPGVVDPPNEAAILAWYAANTNVVHTGDTVKFNGADGEYVFDICLDETGVIASVLKNAPEPVVVSDLEIVKSVSDPTPTDGDNFNWIVTLSNTSATAITNASVADSIPACSTYVSDVATSGTYDDTTGNWTGITIPGNSSESLTITATANAVGLCTNTATISGNDHLQGLGLSDSVNADIQAGITCTCCYLTVGFDRTSNTLVPNGNGPGLHVATYETGTANWGTSGLAYQFSGLATNTGAWSTANNAGPVISGMTTVGDTFEFTLEETSKGSYINSQGVACSNETSNLRFAILDAEQDYRITLIGVDANTITATIGANGTLTNPSPGVWELDAVPAGSSFLTFDNWSGAPITVQVEVIGVEVVDDSVFMQTSFNFHPAVESCFDPATSTTTITILYSGGTTTAGAITCV